MSGCLRFMDLWKQKHESGQWVEIEAEEAMSDSTASAIVLSSMTSEPSAKVRGGDAISETAGSNTNGAGGEQQYHGQHPGFPPWGTHSSPQGGVPVYQAYPMPYFQHYPGFYPPPPPYPSSSPSMDNNRFTNTESEAVNEEKSPEHRKSVGKKRSGRVVIRNINFINSKTETSSESASSDTDIGDHTQQQKRNLRSPKRKGNRKDSKSETLNGKETTDGGHWDAFQTYLLKSAEEGDREDIFAMEKDPKTKRHQKTMGDSDPLSAHARHNDNGEGRHMQSYDTSGRKIVYRSANDDCIMVGRGEEMNLRDGNGFEEANLDKSNGLQHDEAVMVSLRSTSGVNDYNITKGLRMFDLQENKSNKPQDVKYEPDALSLMPERDVENFGYDPAIDYEMQLAASHEKTSKQDKKSKSVAEKHQLSKPNQGMVRKGRPSKVNNNKSTLEDARARADKLRSYKAELQKMKKQQQDAEQKRLEALKMERQKRIFSRTTNSSRKQLPSPLSSSKLSPISNMRKSTKFTDSEPGSSSPLQRSKIRPASINNSKKTSTSSSKLIDRNHSASGNRLTRSLSSMSDTKKELSSVTIPSNSQKTSSMTHIRRLSEPKKVNSTPHTANTKTKSAESVSKPKLFGGPTNTKKISEAIEPSKAAEVKITTSSNIISQKVKVMVKPSVGTTSEVAKQNLNNRLSDANDNPVIDKTVVMLEHNKQPSSIISKEVNSNHRTGVNIREVSMETVDKGTISVQSQKHPTTSSEVCVEEVGKKYEAPYARVSSFEDQSTRNSEYAKAVSHHQAFDGNGTAAYVSNLKMEKIPEKPQPKGGFGRLIKLVKKTPSVQPPPPPQVDTLKSLISADEHAQKPSRRLFSFHFRGEKKATGSGS